MRLGRFSFGVVDWENPVLLEEYYPPDLPVDWRLDFYANEYPVVVVPVAKWQAADEQQLQSWYEDAQDLLYFVLESGDESRHIRMRELLGDSLLGFCNVPALSATGFQFSPLSLGSDAMVLVFLDMEAGNNAHLKALRKHIEALIEADHKAQYYIFIVRSERQQIEAMASVQILLELMGYTV